MRRLAPALIVFALTLVALWPAAASLPQHGDEMQYAWKAGYYWGHVAALDIRGAGPDSFREPGFSRHTFWALEQPLGSHLVYWATMAATRTLPPPLPYSWTDPTLQGPDTAIPAATLPAVRLAAVLCSALGLALIAYRFRWPGLLSLALLAVPDFRADLSRAWAEGPLLLGFGLCALAWGTRWFAPALGIAAAFKLTALGLWPLLLLPASHGFRRWGFAVGPVVALAAFLLLNPVAWFAGPAFLWTLVEFRVIAYILQCQRLVAPGELFTPSRYLWPVVLGAAVAAGQLTTSRNATPVAENGASATLR